MSFERAKEYLEEKGFSDRIIVPEERSATVEEAAAALGTEPGCIAKSLAFLIDERPVLIIAEGMSKVSNPKYKAKFGCKAVMIPRDEVGKLVGHAAGGVCPFGVEPGVTVYLDESLKLHDEVYPACGDDHSAVRLSIKELEECSGYKEWVDVCK